MNYKDDTKKRVTVYLDPVIDSAMEKLAKQENKSKGFMIRTAIECFIQAVYEQQHKNNKEEIKDVK